MLDTILVIIAMATPVGLFAYLTWDITKDDNQKPK